MLGQVTHGLLAGGVLSNPLTFSFAAIIPTKPKDLSFPEAWRVIECPWIAVNHSLVCAEQIRYAAERKQVETSGSKVALCSKVSDIPTSLKRWLHLFKRHISLEVDTPKNLLWVVSNAILDSESYHLDAFL